MAEASLRAAYVAAWQWSRKLMAAIGEGHDVAPPQGLVASIERHMAQHLSL